MKNRKYEKTTIDKITVKGVLSADCSTITFENDDKETETIELGKCLKPFSLQNITLMISNKDVKDMDEEFAED